MVRLLDKNVDGDCRDSGELFWQLSDAQFSTVAIVDKNAVLQERVSYTSYGVGTHRWPHEVNNTGGATTSGTTSDYGVIDGLAGAHSGTGTTIDETAYNVAADLNRDGVIDSGDMSLFTAMGGAKSALASGLISDPSGPDNVFGYDGYFYNPDQGLYTVRFRWYSPTFGRWLERDPIGYRPSKNLFQYVRSRSLSRVDPSGLYDEAGHYYTTFLAAKCAGLSKDQATALAYWSQYPDETATLDAKSLYLAFRLGAREMDKAQAEAMAARTKRIFEAIHSLAGGDAEKRRRCLEKLISAGGLSDKKMGVIIHAFGDSFAHSWPSEFARKSEAWPTEYKPDTLYDWPNGHLKDGTEPDRISNGTRKYGNYVDRLVRSLGGSKTGCINVEQIPPSHKGAINHLRELALAEGLDPEFAPENHEVDETGLKEHLTDAEVDSIVSKIEEACRECPPTGGK